MRSLMKRYSILQDEKRCYKCGTTKNVHIHEVYFGKNRQKSIEDGCCVYLCGNHHNQSKYGVHFDHKFDLYLKKIMELKWLEYYDKTEEDFIKRYYNNYI